MPSIVPSASEQPSPWADLLTPVPPKWPSGPFDVVVADPPWQYWGSQTKAGAAAMHYPTLSAAEIRALPVPDLLAQNAAVFIWATGPKLPDAIATLEAWGLHYRGVAYVWVKTTASGRILGGQGVSPTFTKPTTEFVLAGTTCRKGRPFPILELAQHQVVLAPRGQHSQKPLEVRRRIEALVGPRPRLELFARGEVPGWDTWGLQALEGSKKAVAPVHEPLDAREGSIAVSLEEPKARKARTKPAPRS